MQEVYFNPSKAGSFGGIDALVRNSNAGSAAAKRWLMTQDTYTLHKPVKRKYPRRQIFVPGIDHLWQLDLADVSNISRHNDGVKFLLTCIDCFSRYAFVKTVKNKTAIEIRNAFDEILRHEVRKPSYVQTDKGREFINAIFQSYLVENGIKFYTVENDDIKCSIVERFNKTLKSKMWRYFTYNNTDRFIEALPLIVHAYNNSYHRTIKAKPIDVTPHNQETFYRRIYTPNIKRRQLNSLSPGDTVRISDTRQVFRKAYRGLWSLELFTIRAKLPTTPPTYIIEDLNGEEIRGKFYREELQKIIKADNIFRIEKVLKKRKRKGKTEYFVRWEGYSPKFDSWVENINQ